MKILRFVFAVGTIVMLLFMGNGLASGTKADGFLASTKTPHIIIEPKKTISIGIGLVAIGMFGHRKLIKKSF